MAKFDKDAQIMQKLKKVAEKRSGVSNVELPAGLSAKVRPELEGRIPVDIYDESGDIVSVFPFEREVGRYKEFDTLKPKSSFLPDEYQGKGVSSTLYSKLEDMLNAKIIPDDYQTEAGDALHDKAGYGKKFGLSNKFLKERLSPTAYKELEQRRGAVERGLNQVLEGNVDDFDEAKEMMMDQAMRISDPDKRDTVESTIHNMLRRAAKGSEEGPVDLDSLRSQMKSVGKKVLGVAPLVGPGLALLAGTNPAEAAAEDLLPPGMEPERLGPEQGSEEYNLEMGRIPERLKKRYAEGGAIRQTKGHKIDIENTPEYKSIQKQIDDILKIENPTVDQDMLYSKLIDQQIKLNENAPVLPSLPFTEKGSSRITEKELSQQEIEDIINTHGSMSDLEKEKNKIGHGGYKKVYSTKNPNYLIKESLGNDDNIAREYLTAKKLGLIVGEEIEQPVLVSDPATNKRYQIQRKAVIDPHNEYTKDYINLADKFDNSGIHNPDIHPGNVGRIKGNLKFIDTDSKTNTSKYIDKNDYKQIADRLVKKTDPKVLTKMKVLRSMAGLAPYVGPLLGAGAALYSGESPAAAISEGMLPDAMQPSETGPAKGTDEYKMESGAIPQSLRYSPEEETMIRKRRGYADGGTISSNTAESLKPILKDQQLKIDALKTIKSRKPYKPRKSKKIIP